MVLILSSNSPNAGLVTSVDFLEMETWVALRGPGMLYSILPPLLKVCHQNTLESCSPAAWKIDVNPPVCLSGKNHAALCEKNSPKDTNQAVAEL